MLVLTRKSNQSIMIGDDIEVSVLAIMGEKVRIGIQAPRDIPVFRKEVYLEIQQERLGETKGAREEVDAALRGLSGDAVRSAEQRVERFEHRHRDDDGGGDQRQHEHPEAEGAALELALVSALARAHDGMAPQVLPAAAVELHLLPELLLELRETLAHLHRHQNRAYQSGRFRRYVP